MNDAFHLLKEMGKTFKMVSFEIRRELQQRGLDITRPQGMILRHLYDQDGITQNDLAWVTDRDKTTLARLIDKMEKAGFIRREVDRTDRRIKRVFITPEGREMALELESILTSVAEKLMINLDSGMRRATQETLLHIQKNLTNNCP